MIFGGTKRAVPSEYRAIIKAIEEGDPITPRHAQAAHVEQDGFEVCITPEDREVFEKTGNAVNVLNRHLKWGHWRLQEKPKLLLPNFDDPTVGRRFDIFYRTLPCGEACLYATPRFREEAPLKISAEVDVEHASLFPYQDLRHFCRSLALPIIEEVEPFRQFEAELDRRLTEIVWEAVRSPDQFPSLTVNFEGPAPRLFGQAQENSGALVRAGLVG